MSEPTTDELERVRAAETQRLIDVQRILAEYQNIENPHLAVTLVRYMEAALAAAEARERVLREALEEARDWMGCMCGEVGVCADCAMESRLQAALAAASR